MRRKRVENGTLKDDNIKQVREKQEPAKEMEKKLKKNPEGKKDGWGGGVMEFKAEENI